MLSTTKLVLGAAAIASIASAANIARAPGINISTVTTTFEEGYDLSSQMVEKIPGPYRSIYWGQFILSYDNGPGPDCDYICANTYPLRAVFGPDRYSTTYGSMSSSYNGSKVLNFALENFYFGCESLRNFTAEGLIPPPIPEGFTGVVAAPANCTMTVKGYRSAALASALPNAPADVTYKYAYDPNKNNFRPGVAVGYFDAEASMAQVTLPATFTGLQYVTFQAAAGPGALSPPNVFMDTFTYVTTNITGT